MTIDIGPIGAEVLFRELGIHSITTAKGVGSGFFETVGVIFNDLGKFIARYRGTGFWDITLDRYDKRVWYGINLEDFKELIWRIRDDDEDELLHMFRGDENIVRVRGLLGRIRVVNEDDDDIMSIVERLGVEDA